MKSDLNHRPNCSSIALFYVFLFSPLAICSTYCSTFCSSCHHFNHSFFSLMPLSYSLLFPCYFYLTRYFVYFNLQCFGYDLLYFFEKIVAVIPFFLFSYHHLDFSFLIDFLSSSSVLSVLQYTI